MVTNKDNTVNPKKNILFVGAFKKDTKDGSTGGMAFACSTIIKSSISENVNWVLFDSTPPTNLKRSFLRRSKSAFIRLNRFIYLLIFKKIDAVLIFSASGGSFMEKGLMALLAKMKNKSVIFGPRAGALRNEILKNRKLEKFANKVFKSCDIVICQSQTWKDFYERYTTHPSKAVIIENWLDCDKYNFEDIDKFEKPTIIFLAWLIKEKGIFELLEATVMLNKENYNFDVLICGGGDDEIKAKEYCISNKLHNVKFLGWVHADQKMNLLSKSHIMVLPTYFEGFSNSLLESMASGLAVVSTKVGSAVDIIDHKQNGLLINKKNTSQLKDAISYYLKDLNHSFAIGQEAKNRVLKYNTIEHGVNSFKSILNTI